MEILNVIQGTDGWLEIRNSHFCASEAAAMLGLSKHTTRDELLRLKRHGEKKPILYSKHLEEGHKAEARTRMIVEHAINSKLYPVVVTEEVEGMPFLSSMDGLTIDGEIGWENKQWNAALAMGIGMYADVPDAYWPQLEHQLLTTGAIEIIFTTSSGLGSDEYARITYESVPERRDRLMRGWRLFAKDLSAYEMREIKEMPAPDVETPGLPILFADVSGALVSSNINAFETAAQEFLDGINTVPVDDQDFANAEANVKVCSKAEKALAQAKEAAIRSTVELEAFFVKVDSIGNKLRDSRLTLSKLIKAEKEAVRLKIVIGVSDKFQEHARKRLAGYSDVRPVIDYAFNPREAMKGRKTITGLADAAEHALTQAILDYDRLADAAAIEAREAKRLERERIEQIEAAASEAAEERAKAAAEKAKEEAAEAVERARVEERAAIERHDYNEVYRTIAGMDSAINTHCLAEAVAIEPEMISITLTEYRELTDCRSWQDAFEAAGVDDWDGYPDAMLIYSEYQALDTER